MRYTNERAFTLIEVLVTIFIVGVTAVLFAAAVKTLSFTRDVRYEDTALRIASKKLEELRADGYAGLPASSSFSDALLSSLPSASASTTMATYNAKTKKALVQVGWQPPGQSVRVITLVTLVTQTGGL